MGPNKKDLCVHVHLMFSIAAYVGISVDLQTDGITEKAATKQTVRPNVFSKFLMVYTVSQNTNLPAVSRIFLLVITHILYTTKITLLNERRCGARGRVHQ